MSDAAAIVREAGGEELVERLARLDAFTASPPPRPAPPPPPDAGHRADFDVVLAGGGLSLLHAPLLARAGLRVGVFDRGTIGLSHREWNASAPELRPLVRSGLLSEEELQALVLARYRVGTCRWHGGGVHPVTGVLDHAIDAGGLLARVRAQAQAAGVHLHDFTEVVAEGRGPHGIALLVREAGVTRVVTTRLLVEARGALSPSGAPDLVCPTVGGVLAGAQLGDAPDEYRADVGEILATTEGVEEGRQHVWEAFPGRPGELTVYLFHYARREALQAGELTRLFARFFQTLPRYKRGATRILRPTFGLIPGWSRLSPPPAAGLRTVLVGDAAARHSPLTFCGFGAMLRSFEGTTRGIVRALSDERRLQAAIPSLVHDTPLHGGTGALARLLASPPRDPARAGALNALLDDAFATLAQLGEQPYGRLLRDEASMAEFVTFLRRTAARHPQVYGEVFARLGPLAVSRWGLSLASALVGRPEAA